MNWSPTYSIREEFSVGDGRMCSSTREVKPLTLSGRSSQNSAEGKLQISVKAAFNLFVFYQIAGYGCGVK